MTFRFYNDKNKHETENFEMEFDTFDEMVEYLNNNFDDKISFIQVDQDTAKYYPLFSVYSATGTDEYLGEMEESDTDYYKS